MRGLIQPHRRQRGRDIDAGLRQLGHYLRPANPIQGVGIEFQRHGCVDLAVFALNLYFDFITGCCAFSQFSGYAHAPGTVPGARVLGCIGRIVIGHCCVSRVVAGGLMVGGDA